MRGAWAGIGVASVGLVLSALLWTFAVASAADTDPPVCTGRFDDEVPCSVAGVDMTYGGPLSLVLLVVSLSTAYGAIRLGDGRRRRRPRRRDRD